MAPNDLSRAFYIRESGNVLGWRIVRQGGAVLSYDAGNRSFSPFDVLPEDKAVNLVPYDYVNGKVAAVNESIRTAGENLESFYLGNVKVMQTPDGFMCQPHGASEYVPLRTDIRDIKAGDAFMLSSEPPFRQGQILVAARDSHQNFDELDEPWIVYDSQENGWFEEDICTDPYSAYVNSNATEQAPAQSVEKSSLSDQIRQAETRTALTNTEKEPRNIEKDR